MKVTSPLEDLIGRTLVGDTEWDEYPFNPLDEKRIGKAISKEREAYLKNNTEVLEMFEIFVSIVDDFVSVVEEMRKLHTDDKIDENYFKKTVHSRLNSLINSKKTKSQILYELEDLKDYVNEDIVW